MANVKYRSIEKRDYQAISKLIEKSFHLDELILDKKLLSLFTKNYLYDCLSEATYVEVAEIDNQVVGVIMGNADADYSYVKHAKDFFCVWLQKIKIYVNTNKKELDIYNELLSIYDSFYQKHKEKFDGVLTLFAVSENHRGFGIGKQLLTDLLAYLEEAKVEHIYLFTDNTCNYGFYEHYGFTRLEEEEMTFELLGESQSMSVYFYEYTLRKQSKK